MQVSRAATWVGVMDTGSILPDACSSPLRDSFLANSTHTCNAVLFRREGLGTSSVREAALRIPTLARYVSRPAEIAINIICEDLNPYYCKIDCKKQR